MGDDDKVEMISPPNTLKTKVGKGGPGAVSPEMLERAEQVIADLTDDYLEWVVEDLEKLVGAFNDLKEGKGEAKDLLDKVFQITHDMKGQGGSFGYDLITIVGNDLCRFLEDLEKPGPDDIKVIALHVDAMRVIITENIKGEGGKVGKQLLAGLDLVSTKARK